MHNSVIVQALWTTGGVLSSNITSGLAYKALETTTLAIANFSKNYPAINGTECAEDSLSLELLSYAVLQPRNRPLQSLAPGRSFPLAGFVTTLTCLLDDTLRLSSRSVHRIRAERLPHSGEGLRLARLDAHDHPVCGGLFCPPQRFCSLVPSTHRPALPSRLPPDPLRPRRIMGTDRIKTNEFIVDLKDALPGLCAPGITGGATGGAVVSLEGNAAVESDIISADIITIPICLAILAWVLRRRALPTRRCPTGSCAADRARWRFSL